MASSEQQVQVKLDPNDPCVPPILFPGNVSGNSSGQSTTTKPTTGNLAHHVTNKVSFLEFVEVSTDSSISPDITSVGGQYSPTQQQHYHHQQRPLPYSFHYEPLRPPAAINIPSSIVPSSTPQLVSTLDPLATPHFHSPLPPTSHPYSLPMVDFVSPPPNVPIDHHRLTPTSFYTSQPSTAAVLTTPPLISYWSSDSAAATLEFQPEVSHTPLLATVSAVSTTIGGGHHINDQLISKSSSSDSDTNDSGTRLISDSLHDISNSGGGGGGVCNIYYMQPEHGSLRSQRMSPQLMNGGQRISSPSSGKIDTILEQSGENSEFTPDTQNKFDSTLWIQMQNDVSKDLREKYLNTNGNNSGNSGKKCKKEFQFRRFGWSRFGFVCPLRKSTTRKLAWASLVLVLSVILLVALVYCYKQQLLFFGPSGHKQRYQFELDQHWHQDTTVYEIFPSSFKDTDGDGFGDLRGIADKVSHLRALGISAIRLNSIFAALDYPQRYENVLNFLDIDPHLGSFNDFIHLIDTMHRNHIRVILELNPTMTSDQHQWAAHWAVNQSGEFANFYQPRLEKKGPEQTSIDTMDVESRSVMLEDSQQYFGAALKLNWSHEAVRIQMLKVADYWLRHVDGLYLKNLHQIYVDSSANRDQVLRDFLQRLRRIVDYHQKLKSHELGLVDQLSAKKILICSSELVDPYLSRIKRHRKSSSTQPEVLDLTPAMNHHVMPLNTTHNRTDKTNGTTTTTQNNFTVIKQQQLYSFFDLIHFELKVARNETDNIRDQVNYVFLNRPADFPMIMWSVGSVHRSRLATRYGSQWVLASAFLLTMMPGTVSMFYGDEIGLQDVYDIYTQNYYRGGQLCPMAWSSISPNGNFSRSNVTTSQLWLPAHPDYSQVNVEKRSKMVKIVSDLIHFRLDHFFSEQIEIDAVTKENRIRLANSDTNYLFHYIDHSIVVLERYFDRTTELNNEPLTRYRYVLFANLGLESQVKDFADKFHFSITKLATNMNRTSEFLIMRQLKLDPGEAMIATVE